MKLSVKMFEAMVNEMTLEEINELADFMTDRVQYLKNLMDGTVHIGDSVGWLGPNGEQYGIVSGMSPNKGMCYIFKWSEQLGRLVEHSIGTEYVWKIK